jgi:hypothetical protein
MHHDVHLAAGIEDSVVLTWHLVLVVQLAPYVLKPQAFPAGLVPLHANPSILLPILVAVRADTVVEWS